MVNRESYLSQLIKFRDQDLIKVVTGIRRCGKSTLLMAFRQYLYSDGVQKNAVVLRTPQTRRRSLCRQNGCRRSGFCGYEAQRRTRVLPSRLHR